MRQWKWIPIYLISNCFCSPPNVGYTDSSKWQSTNLVENETSFLVSKYLIIERDSYLTYIPNLLWRSIFVHCGGTIETYSAQPKILWWEMFCSWPKTNYNGGDVMITGWPYAHKCCCMFNNMPQTKTYNFVIINKGPAIN